MVASMPSHSTSTSVVSSLAQGLSSALTRLQICWPRRDCEFGMEFGPIATAGRVKHHGVSLTKRALRSAEWGAKSALHGYCGCGWWLCRPIAPFGTMLFQDASIPGICFGKSSGSGQFATIKSPGHDICRSQYLVFGVGSGAQQTQ